MTAHPDPLRTPLCDLLGCDVPVILAGMGGVARSELAAAVALAGGYPTLGMVREDPALIESEIAALRRATDKPFAVNLIPAATEPGLLDAQIGTCLDLGVTTFSFFWDVVPDAVERVKKAGCKVLHQIGNIEAARRAEAVGADVLIAQGCEAGGHVHGRTGAFALADSVLTAASVPVVISGGITTGRGLAAALGMGAVGVQCGTAFLATTEAFAHDYHKRRIIDATSEDTVLTDGFVLNWPAGSAVRVLKNSVTAGFGDRLLGHDPAQIPSEVIAYDGDTPRFRQSTDSPMRTTTGELEAMSLYAGQGVDAVTSVVSAGDRLRYMADDARRCLSDLQHG
ncbi:nitronate monooxygenase [Pseudohalocynthiibacter aestuariivivens]|nr:nitronate monooxygenase [Pseudohalocynthiibacter aestuariivivens]QIE44986.1 nitronate monooxygenase [Pseudohalocynthiibacter aestuariivivens]